MTFPRRSCFLALLAVMFGWPAWAADEPAKAPVRKPAVREAKRLPAPGARPGDAQYQELTGQVVYQVLLAELALQRGDTELASRAYADLALRTRDPKVIERTVEVAIYARRNDLALEAARLWLEVEPNSKRAQQLLHGVMIMSNQIDDLAPYLIKMLESDKEALADSLLGLNRLFARNPDRVAVFRLIDRVCAPFTGIAEAHYAVAVAASAAGARERALTEARRAQELRPDWEQPAMLQAQLLLKESPEEALDYMQQFVAKNPQAREVQLMLARTLVGNKRYGEARRLFEQLLQDFPNSPEVVYAVALLAMQDDDKTLAEEQLHRLAGMNIPDKSIPFYYLGQIAEDAGRMEEALAYYAQVGAGDQYLSAQLRSARLMAEQGRFDAARRQLKTAQQQAPEYRLQFLISEAGILREARQYKEAFDVLEPALKQQPENTDLLYESALIAEKLGRMEILEARLRKLIELKPDSAQAYNALGYSYADRNERLPEAKELIEKALKLAPDDPYILDSMGWVLYRQGDLPGALAQLERAWEKRPDPEIAAHIGEVLWKMGRKDDALRVLREAKKKFPTSEAVDDALKMVAP